MIPSKPTGRSQSVTAPSTYKALQNGLTTHRTACTGNVITKVQLSEVLPNDNLKSLATVASPLFGYIGVNFVF